MQTMTVTAFKARALEKIAQVEQSKEPIAITRHGHPVAMLSPWTGASRETSYGGLAGSILREENLVYPVTESDEWEANR